VNTGARFDDRPTVLFTAVPRDPRWPSAIAEPGVRGLAHRESGGRPGRH